MKNIDEAVFVKLVDANGKAVGDGDTLLYDNNGNVKEIKIIKISNNGVIYQDEFDGKISTPLNVFSDILKLSTLLRSKKPVLKDKQGRVVKEGDILVMDSNSFNPLERIMIVSITSSTVQFKHENGDLNSMDTKKFIINLKAAYKETKTRKEIAPLSDLKARVKDLL
jgi:hypothetical protein